MKEMLESLSRGDWGTAVSQSLEEDFFLDISCLIFRICLGLFFGGILKKNFFPTSTVLVFQLF